MWWEQYQVCVPFICLCVAAVKWCRISFYWYWDKLLKANLSPGIYHESWYFDVCTSSLILCSFSYYVIGLNIFVCWVMRLFYISDSENSLLIACFSFVKPVFPFELYYAFACSINILLQIYFLIIIFQKLFKLWIMLIYINLSWNCWV